MSLEIFHHKYIQMTQGGYKSDTLCPRQWEIELRRANIVITSIVYISGDKILHVFTSLHACSGHMTV